MMDFIVKTRFDKMFTAWNEKKGYRPGLHASSVLAPAEGATGFCYREHVLSSYYQSSSQPMAVHVLRIFLAGWSIHQKWQQLFQEAGIAENVETTRNAGHWGLFHTPDAVICMDHVRYIVEIKSMNTAKFMHLNGPPANAVHQANLYMYLTGIPNAIILVEDKNTQEFKTWLIEFDLDLVLPYLDRLAGIQEYTRIYAERHVLPKRVSACQTPASSRAKGCPYAKACFADRVDRVALELSVPLVGD